MTRWNYLKDVPWDRFRADLVDPDLLKVVKTASVVEGNSSQYGAYLRNVFSSDPAFCKFVSRWVEEEVQHGLALGAWAEKADPGFSVKKSVEKFKALYRVPTQSEQSVRGSRALELIARCVVETGTHSFYTALAEASREPVLRAIAGQIATDEFVHYSMFHKYYRRYANFEKPSLRQRALVLFARAKEISDDELGLAYHVTHGADRPYDSKKAYDEYSALAYSIYRRRHWNQVAEMTGRVVEFPFRRLLEPAFATVGSAYFRLKSAK